MSKVKDLGRVLRDDKSAKDNKNYEIRLPKRNSELRIGKFLYKQQKQYYNVMSLDAEQSSQLKTNTTKMWLCKIMVRIPLTDHLSNQEEKWDKKEF